MEKYADRPDSKSCRRLLIFLFFLLFRLFSLNAINTASYENLSFSPAEENLYITDEEIFFDLIVPFSSSKNVTLRLPDFDKNILVKSITKGDFWDENNNRGTEFRLELLFTEKGIYQLPSASVLISRRSYSVHFDSLEIKQNPYELHPEMTLKITDSNGKTIKQMDFSSESVIFRNTTELSLSRNQIYRFSVLIRNISKIESLSWTIPHNAIFTLKNDWEIAAAAINEETPQLNKNQTENNADDLTLLLMSKDFEKQYLLAEFEWTVLASAENEFPEFRLVCRDFSNNKNLVEAKKVKILISGSESDKLKKSDEVENDDFFQNAFISDSETDAEKKDLSYEECLALVQKEKSELKLFSKFSRKKYGIILKTELFSIPEENSSRIVSIDGGEKVEIKEKTENWLYVEALEDKKKSGWCKKNKILMIN